MEISERFGFNLPSRDGDDLADINQISNNFRIVEDVVPYVDENYDPKSKNPQSGEAVFGAIKTVRNPILDYIVYEIVEDGTVDIVSCDRAIKGDYIIPDTIDGYPVTSIGKSFSPASRWAFEGCENLTSIVIPDSVTLIGISAFSSCYNLKKIVMGSGVSTIGESAFYNCLALKEITISENITKIDTGAFEKVDNLVDVYYSGTPEQWNEIIVRGINEPLVNATIHFNYDSTPTTKGYVDEALRNAVDQTYSPESPNAQSGVAVAEAFDRKELKHIKTITLEEAVTSISTTFEKPLKELWVRFIGALDIEAKVTDCVLSARCDAGIQYFAYFGNQTFEPNQKKVFAFHAKEIVPRNWETEFCKTPITGSETNNGYFLQGISAQTSDLRKSYSTRTQYSLTPYVNDLDFAVHNGKYSFAIGSTLEIWGVEVDE